MKFVLPILYLISSAVFSQNLLIKNTSFEEELYGWDYGVSGSKKFDRPIAKFATIDNARGTEAALNINIEKSFPRGTANQVYLVQDRLKLKKGKKYSLSFYVKSSVGEDQIRVSIGSGSAANGRKAMVEKITFMGDNKWKKISRKFVAKSLDSKKEVEFKNAAIYFGFNFRDGEYQIDKVKVERIK